MSIQSYYDKIEYDANIRKWTEKRKRAKVTQNEVAEDLGITNTAVSKYEHLERRSMIFYYYYKEKFGGKK